MEDVSIPIRICTEYTLIEFKLNKRKKKFDKIERIVKAHYKLEKLE